MKNNFKVPRGSAGKDFVSELAKLFRSVGEGSALELIALKAVFVLCILVLQKPSRNSKERDHTRHLEHRLKLWKDGALDELVREGRVIQSRLRNKSFVRKETQITRSFTKLMFEGSVRAALQLLVGRDRGGVLNLDDPADPTNPGYRVRDALRAKHPPAQPLRRECLLPSTNASEVHPVLFDTLDASAIRSAALRTTGAAGPSGIDAREWRRLCTSFHAASDDLCTAIALFARRLCTTYLSPEMLSPFLACRLIALDKSPGVRPIGVCEVVRRIVAKAALHVIRDDIQAVAGPLQLCTGQIAGTEAAVHVVRSLFGHADSDAILLVDASNALNSLNRSVALHNIQQLCPSLACVLINTYRSPASLFISGDTLLSEEGTTQGDPLAMPMYAIAMIPLIRRLTEGITQVWYADDACACGRLSDLRLWWDQLCREGPGFGYFPNASKTWLVTKESCRSDAEITFAGTNVNLTDEGRPYLGAAIGTNQFITQFVMEKVEGWSADVTRLAKIAQSQPHAVYSAFTKGLSSRWIYVSRTIPDIAKLLQPLEDAIRLVLIPALTGRAPPQ